MMGIKEKLVNRFKSQPKDFTFDELTCLLAFFGFELSNKGKSSGSRVVFRSEQFGCIMLHKPHPSKIVKGYAMKQILERLIELGLM